MCHRFQARPAVAAWLIFTVSLLGLTGCQDHEQQASKPIQQSQPEEEKSQSNAEEVFSGPSCAELEIPSWQRRVARLSDELCARCHNDNFAWNGVRLHTYEEFVLNSEASIERIRAGDFDFNINILQVRVFVDWFDAGMPETEQDCADMME